LPEAYLKLFNLKQFLEILKTKYFLDLRDYKFSPTTQVSLGICLSYVEGYKKDNPVPLIISFPNRHDASLWISVGILVNKFFEEYINRAAEAPQAIKNGSRISIFNVEAILQRRIDNGKDKDKFKVLLKDCSLNLDSGILRHAKVIDSSRKPLGERGTFKHNRTKFFKKLNAISRILEADLDKALDPRFLESKIVVVSGRGNTGALKALLKNTKIYDEKLSDIFRLDSNLIVNVDLEHYRNYFVETTSQQAENFKSIFLAYCAKHHNNELLAELRQNASGNDFQNQEFLNRYEEYIDFCEESELLRDVDVLKNILRYHPGINTSIPKKLRAVVIDSMEVVENYQHTVQSLLTNGVPVIIICDRTSKDKDELTKEQFVLTKFTGCCRFIWTRKKLGLLVDSASSNVLDNDLWNSSRRYSKQKIKFITFNSPLDKQLAQVQRIFTQDFPGHERLKAAYWKYLHPAGHILKNQPGLVNVDYPLDKFKEVYRDSKMTLPSDANVRIDQLLELVSEGFSNPKVIGNNAPVFGQNIVIDSAFSRVLPQTQNKIVLDVKDLSSIIFTGLPYKEHNFRNLISAVCDHSIPNIEILAWHTEFVTIRNYLVRNIQPLLFEDYLPEWQFPKELVFTNGEVPNEINITHYSNEKVNDVLPEPDYDFDLIHQNISKARLSEYTSGSFPGRSFTVKANVILFEDDSIMFLPHGSTIWAQQYSMTAEVRLKKCLINEIRPGSRIFQYSLKAVYRVLAKKNSDLSRAFRDLDIWRSGLKDLYHSLDEDIDALEQKLLQIKADNKLGGNPARHNLMRWLNDEYVLCPDDDNLAVILIALGHKDYHKQADRIFAAYHKISGHNISLSSKIKKWISDYVEKNKIKPSDVFQIPIDEAKVTVHTKIVADINKEDYVVDYFNTRKILE
jgi:hypothetical protein